MKKLLFLLCLFVSASVITEAQTAKYFPIVAGDTVITSGSLDTMYKILPVTSGYSSLGIQVNGTKVSGTITSKAYLYGSLDGSVYLLTDSSAAFANAAGTQAVWFTKTNPPYAYYKISVRPPSSATTTESLAVKIWYTLRKFTPQ